MKTAVNQPGKLLLLLLLILSGSAHADSQHPYAGTWEGKFMGDFRTTIQIIPSEEGYTGHIKMYSGPQVIQDDPLADITVKERQITFQIPAKETSFIGEFDEGITRLSGKFIFPDGSEHPLEVQKNAGNINENGTAEKTFREYKQELFDAAALKEDLHFLLKKLEENHPRLYNYTSEEDMKTAVERILNEIERPMGLEEYFRLIAPVVDMIRCSHTGIRYPAAYTRLLVEQREYFPVEVRCHQGRIYYISSAGHDQTDIEPGTEIATINGLAAADIIDRLFDFIPTEGFNTSAEYYQLNHHFQEFFQLLDPSEFFKVEFITPQGIREELLHACALKEVGKIKVKDFGEVPVVFSLIHQGSTGILRVPTFGIHDMEGYMGELTRVFSALDSHATGSLILDLRGNAGGHPIFAAQLLSYLVNEDFTYFKRNPEATEFEPLYMPMHPDPHHFKGNLFVLVDGGCLSTTGHLISLIKYHTDAQFIGEEPGSTFRCNDFSTQVSLPHTGIEVNIPRLTFETAVEGFREGTPFPLDFHVQFSINDIVHGIDRSMVLGQELVADL